MAWTCVEERWWWNQEGWMDGWEVDGWMIDVSTEKSTFCIISCPFTLEQSGVSAEGRQGDIDSHSFSLRWVTLVTVLLFLQNNHKSESNCTVNAIKHIDKVKLLEMEEIASSQVSSVSRHPHLVRSSGRRNAIWSGVFFFFFWDQGIRLKTHSRCYPT